MLDSAPSEIIDILLSEGIIGIDCETTVSRAIDRQICTLQVSHEDGRKGAIYLYDQPDLIRSVMQAITDSPATLIAYNATFEMEVFLKHGGCPKNLKCAMVATKVLREVIEGRDLPPVYTLKAVAARELGMEMDKSIRDRDWRIPMDQEAYDYAMLDADAALELWAVYSAEFANDPDSYNGFNIINDAIEAIASSNLTGLAFNRSAHAEMIRQQHEICAEYIVAMDAVCNEEISNHGSPAIVSRWIARQLSFENKCTPIRASMLFQQMTGESWKSSTVGFSLDKHVVERVLPTVQAYWPRVALYLSLRAAYQKVAKLLQAFGEALDSKLDEGDILRCSLIPHGAKTSRMSSRDPNLQQMPAEQAFRAMFIARPNRVLVLADYSQIELRVGCLIANDLVMQNIFRLGKDIHSATAENIHGITYDPANPQHVKWRKQGKPVTFSCIARGQLVLTNEGLVPIQDVTIRQLVWDGIEWVAHQGVICHGLKPVITVGPLTATPDHEVFINGTTRCRLDRLGQGLLSRTGDGRFPVRVGLTAFRNHAEPIALHGAVLGQGGQDACRDSGDPAPAQEVLVYDLINAGPRNRFTVSDCLVSNCLYGAQAATVAMNSGLGMDEAEELLNKWLDAYPGIRAYRDDQPGLARALGYVQLVSGQKIKVHETARASQLINAPVQGSSASVMYLAMTYTHQALKDAGVDAKIALVVHDEILIDSAPDCATQAADILQSQMARALVDLYPEVAHLGLENVAEAVIGQSWADKA